MNKMNHSSSRRDLTRLETSIASPWVPIVGSNYAHALAVGRGAEFARLFLALSLSVLSLIAFSKNLAIANLLLILQLIAVVLYVYFASRRVRRTGKAMLVDLKRLGFDPSCAPKLTRKDEFKKWMVKENLTSSIIAKAGSLENHPDDIANDNVH